MPGFTRLPKCRQRDVSTSAALPFGPAHADSLLKPAHRLPARHRDSAPRRHLGICRAALLDGIHDPPRLRRRNEGERTLIGTDVAQVHEQLGLPHAFGIEVIDLAGDRLLAAMVHGIQQVDPIEVRNGAEVVRDQAEQRVRQREVDELRVPRQILVGQDAAQERPLLRCCPMPARRRLELALLLLEQLQRERDDLVGAWRLRQGGSIA